MQVAILTERIVNLTEHLKTHKKDGRAAASVDGRLKRRNLLDYIKKGDEGAYKELIDALTAPAAGAVTFRIAYRAWRHLLPGFFHVRPDRLPLDISVCFLAAACQTAPKQED